MASVKNLKKDINYILGDIIEECYMWELSNPEKDTKKSQAIIDEAISNFDSLIGKVNDKTAENRRTHYKTIQSDLEKVATDLLKKVNKL